MLTSGLACPYNPKHHRSADQAGLTAHIRAQHDLLYQAPNGKIPRVLSDIIPPIVYIRSDVHCGNSVGIGERCRQPIRFNTKTRVDYCPIHGGGWALDPNETASILRGLPFRVNGLL